MTEPSSDRPLPDEPYSDRPRPKRSVLLPLLLILLGSYLLAQKLGWQLPNIGPLVVRFWPLLLIILGLELLLSRWQRGLGLLLGLLISGALVWGFTTAGKIEVRAGVIDTQIDQSLAGATRGEVTVDIDAANVRIEALPPGSDRFAEGTYSADGLQLEQRYNVKDGVGKLELDSHGTFLFFDIKSKGMLDLRLNPDLPLVLEMDSSATDLNIDLSELQIEEFKLDMSASDGELILPSQGRIVVDASASSLTVVVPPEVAARIRIDSSASSEVIDSERFVREGEYYVTRGAQNAEKRIEVELQTSATSISIK